MSLKIEKPWHDPRYFAAAPTRDQAKRIFWKDLKALTPKSYVSRLYESDLCIETVFGSELWVVGLDKPERIEGVPWDGGVLDEYANMRAEAWPEHVRPALSDRQGWCWFIGVPEGYNHYKDIADYAKSGVDDEWGHYSWPSKEILPSVEIEAARRHLDEKTFRQEYEATFEGRSSRVYYAYDMAVHYSSDVIFDKSRPIFVCCDFNVDPCVWILCQSDGHRVWVFDELVLRNTNTIEMGTELLKRYGAYLTSPGIVIYGDSAGKARSTGGRSDLAILHELGFTRQRVKRSNPYVKDRVNSVNAMLRNTRGEVRLTHHPRCEYLRGDLTSVVWSDNFDLDKRDRDRTHATDALGYFIEFEFPLRIERPEQKKKFYK